MPVRTCEAHSHRSFVLQMPSSIGSTPNSTGAWPHGLPRSGTNFTLLSWRGSTCRPNFPLSESWTSVSVEDAAAFWAWLCKTALVWALATNFSNSIFMDDTGLEKSGRIVAFCDWNVTFCDQKTLCSRNFAPKNLKTRRIIATRWTFFATRFGKQKLETAFVSNSDERERR